MKQRPTAPPGTERQIRGAGRARGTVVADLPFRSPDTRVGFASKVDSPFCVSSAFFNVRSSSLLHAQAISTRGLSASAAHSEGLQGAQDAFSHKRCGRDPPQHKE